MKSKKQTERAKSKVDLDQIIGVVVAQLADSPDLRSDQKVEIPQHVWTFVSIIRQYESWYQEGKVHRGRSAGLKLMIGTAALRLETVAGHGRATEVCARLKKILGFHESDRTLRDWMLVVKRYGEVILKRTCSVGSIRQDPEMFELLSPENVGRVASDYSTIKKFCEAFGLFPRANANDSETAGEKALDREQAQLPVNSQILLESFQLAYTSSLPTLTASELQESSEKLESLVRLTKAFQTPTTSGVKFSVHAQTDSESGQSMSNTETALTQAEDPRQTRFDWDKNYN